MHTYQGSCHCERIRFELDGRIGRALECNCSICRMKGALWHGAEDAQLRVLAGESELGLYQFGTKTARHYFCRHCGIGVFSRPRLDPSRWAVNLRCVAGVDLSSLTVHPFDGQDWESAARQLLQHRGSQSRS